MAPAVAFVGRSCSLRGQIILEVEHPAAGIGLGRGDGSADRGMETSVTKSLESVDREGMVPVAGGAVRRRLCRSRRIAFRREIHQLADGFSDIVLVGK